MERTDGLLTDVIRQRRSIRDFNGVRLEPEVVRGILRDAQWAPFHSKVEPWRFILFMEEGRKRFADAVIATYTKEVAEKWGEWAYRQYCERMQAHVLVVIPADPRQKYWEDAFGAASALIQNVQLLAWNQGVGTVWKTNEYNWAPSFHQQVGIAAHERIVGTLHLGYFDKAPRAKARAPLETLLTEIMK